MLLLYVDDIRDYAYGHAQGLTTTHMTGQKFTSWPGLRIGERYKSRQHGRRNMRWTFASAILAAFCVLMAPPSYAQVNIRVGVLECDISAGMGLIFTEKQSMKCVYQPDDGGAPDYYMGSVEEFGLEIGATSGGVLTWVVASAQRGVSQGALAGTYVGVSANASVGAGIGANDLSGGFERAYILQPYSVQTQTGVNVAAGVAKVTLKDIP